ncbi:MAG: type II secretion system secretin GspD [Bradymonadales bacterium]|nr:type II secretion system secretin GspD [Bradymonadales bacterium]
MAAIEAGWRRCGGLLPLALLLWISSVAVAQEEGGSEDAAGEAANPPGGTRPGVIRLTTPTEAEAEEETEGQQTTQQVEAEEEGPPPSTGFSNQQPAQAAPPSSQEVAGPPLIEPRRLVQDVDEEVPRHFEENFDPFHPPRGLRVTIDFPQAPLSEVVLWMSALTGQNFIIAEGVEGTITIIGPTPVTIEEAYRAFLAALHMNGLTIVPYGSFLRIVREEDVQRHALPFTAPGTAPPDDRMVTQLVPLRFVDAAQLSELLGNFTSANGRIQVYAPTNTLIVTETGTNMRRLLGLIGDLDTPGGETRFLYQVRYADAEQLRSTLLEIFGEQQQQQRTTQTERATTARERRRRAREQEAEPTPSATAATETVVTVSQIIADQRTNQLIIVTSPRGYQAVREMIEALDIPIAGEGQIHVVFLENANATDLASTLQSLVQNVQQAQEEQTGSSRTRRTRAAAEEESPAVTTTGAISATFGSNVSITADEATNSMVVVASLRDFLSLQRVIDQLDRRREQVYVEAVIMEITAESDGDFGIALNAGALPTIRGDEIPIYAATSLGGMSSIVLDPTALMGLAMGLRGPDVPGTQGLLGVTLPSFGAILNALQSDRNVNVLSTPHILTTDNEEAEIIVGQNVPFVTGGYGNIGSLLGSAGGLDTGNLGDLASLASLSNIGSYYPSYSVTRESVSLTLRVRPQINASNFVRLEIEEQVEGIIGESYGSPVTSNREARTVVVVEDQQTVVIGGLIEDEIQETVEKVPFLGDIPVIGYLFRSTTTRNVKRNLLLLLTPYIIRDSADFHEIFRRKMQERQEFLEFFGREQLDYVANVDYTRKNGPLQSMFQTILRAVQNEEARRRAQGQFEGPQLLQGMDAAPLGGEEGRPQPRSGSNSGLDSAD